MLVNLFDKMEGARDFVNELRDAGIQAHIPEMPFGLKLPDEFVNQPSELIAIGCSCDPLEAVPVIQAAVERWPHLKYWHLSSDNNAFTTEEEHNELSIGCHTEGALKKGVRPWTPEEFAELDAEMGVTAFHYLIRSSVRSPFNTLITFTGGIHDGQSMRMPYPAKSITQMIHRDGIWRQSRQDEPGACDCYEIRIVADDRIECHFLRTDRG